MNFKSFLFILAVLLTGSSAFSQKQEDISRLFTKSPALSPRAIGLADDMVPLKINTSFLQKIYKEKNYDISLTLPISDNETITMEMSQFSVLNEGFILRTSKGDTITDYEPGLFYKGKIKGKKGYATLNVFKDQVMGIIAIEGIGNIDLVKVKGSNVDYVVYQDRKIKIEKNLRCDTPDDAIDHGEKDRAHSITKRADSGICVYIEGDYALYQDKGSVEAATDYITALFAEVEVLYDEIDVSIGINEIMIWEEPDGYDQNDSGVALEQFRDNNPDPNGALASLYALGGNGTGGLAWLGVLCLDGWKYAYMNISSGFNSVPTYSWSVEVVTHEMGHNFGSHHTHACVWNGDDTQIDDCGSVAGYNEGSCYDPNNPILPDAGTIMSYCHLVNGVGIDFNLGFGEQPGDLITDNYNSASCIDDCTLGQEPPVADFEADPEVICEGEDVYFYDLSTNNPTAWDWTFDGGSPDGSDEQEPIVTYYDAGIYDVTLVASNSGGEDEMLKEEFITVNAIAIPEYTYEIFNDNEVHFTNTSEIATTYYWDFDDGDDSDEENPIHTYDSDGTYAVTLYASNDECTEPEEYTLYIDIVTHPTAGMTMDHYEGCKPDTIHFYDNSSDNVDSRYWTFEAGTPASSTLKNPIVKYDTAGKFNVQLIVYNALYSDTIKYIDTIFIHDKPKADFIYTINGNVVTFTNKTFDGNTFNWNYGDGTTSTDTNSVHTYSAGGDYNVRLIATNDCGKDTITKQIHLTLEANADFTVDTTRGCVVFDANFHSLANTDNISWIFEGGVPNTSTQLHPVVHYNNPGKFDVTMYATNNLGKDTLVRPEYIEVIAQPMGDFTYSVSGYVANFTQTTTDIDGFSWNFGDGATSTDVNPNHTYASDGTYTVKFTYYSVCDTVTKEKNVIIANPPLANFSYDVSSGCSPLTVHFTNESSPNSESFQWTFEGGTPASSTEENPTVVFNESGKFDVALKAINSVSTDTKTEVDLIEALGGSNPDFTTTSNELDVTFTYTGETATSISWDFGDGQTGTGSPVTHTYSAQGDYLVKVTAVNDCGENELERQISVAAIPTAMFNAYPKEGCAPLEVSFTNLSSSANSIKWLFDGGDPAVVLNDNAPTVRYVMGGEFDVTLIAYGTNGNDTMTTEAAVVVDAGPDVGFSFTKNNGEVTFTSECSSDANSFVWDFGDGNISDEKNPVHQYASTGTYTVTLYANNDCGQKFESKDISVKVTGINEIDFNEVRLYPNPNDGNFYLSIDVKEEGDYTIKIHNMLGKLVDRQIVKLSSGRNVQKFVRGKLSSGNYIMSIVKGKKKYDMLFNVR